jgi:carboxymethylenebutenolidase
MKNALPLLPRIAAVFVCATCGVTAVAAHSQDWAKAVLNKSPRHQEWVKVTYGSRTVNAFVVYPEVSHKAPVVLLIHEIFGLTDWARSQADDIAAMGYIVIAPDLLSGFGPNGGDTSAFPDMQSTTKAVSGLDPATVTADLNAAADYALKFPAANGKLAVIGFCWGGGQSFRFATQRKDLSAASSSTDHHLRPRASPKSARRFMDFMRRMTRALRPQFRPRKTRWPQRARSMRR